MRVLIIGTGAQAKYVAEIFKLQKVETLGLLDISQYRDVTWAKYYNIRVLGGLDILNNFKNKNIKIIVTHINNKEKELLTKRVKNANIDLVNAVHPTSFIASTVQLGTNVIINANVAIQPFAKIGDGVMIHAGVIVEHDNVIEDYANLAPGVKLSGWVRIKKGAYIYTGVSIIPKITIGENAIVGAGSVVIEDIPSNVVVAGVPAKIISKNQS